MPAIDGDIGDAEMPEPVMQQRKRKQKNKDGTASRWIHDFNALIVPLSLKS
jgi:hypothetical protein